MKKFLLTLTDYNRIHQVARGVIEGLGTAERSCIIPRLRVEASSRH